MLRTVLKFIVGLAGLALTSVFLAGAIRDASAMGYVKAAFALLVTARLLFLLRENNRLMGEGVDGVRSKRNAKLIAIGLAIGFGVPLLILWLITASTR